MPLVTLCVRQQLCLPYQGRCPAGAEGWTAPAARTPPAAARKDFSTKNKKMWKTFRAHRAAQSCNPRLRDFQGRLMACKPRFWYNEAENKRGAAAEGRTL